MRRLVFGCGYLGLRVARLWLADGGEVHVVTRSAEGAERLASEGLRPVVADVTDRASLADLPHADTILFAVGYDRGAGPSQRAVYVDGLAAALDAASQPDRFIYISTTGVYGQGDGETVDEDSSCRPERESARVCLAAEETCSAHAIGSRAIVMRLAGLYGPGRIPRAQDVLSGRPIEAQPDGWLNLIHVVDAARAVLAAEARIEPPRRLLISDGRPVRREDYFAELARLYGGPAPQFAPPAAPRGRRGETNKRVDPARSLAALDIALEFASYREGLADAIAHSAATGGSL